MLKSLHSKRDFKKQYILLLQTSLLLEFTEKNIYSCVYIHCIYPSIFNNLFQMV